MSYQTPNKRATPSNEYKVYYNNEKRKMTVKYPFLSPQQLHRRVQKLWTQKKHQCMNHSTKQNQRFESPSTSALSPSLLNQISQEDTYQSPASSPFVKIPKYTFINGRKQKFTTSRLMHAVAGPGILVTNKNKRGTKNNRRVSFSEDDNEDRNDRMMTPVDCNNVTDGVKTESDGENTMTRQLSKDYEKLAKGDMTEGHSSSDLQSKDTANTLEDQSGITCNGEMCTNDIKDTNKEREVSDKDCSSKILSIDRMKTQSKDGLEQLNVDGQNSKPVTRKRGRPRKTATVEATTESNDGDIRCTNKGSAQTEVGIGNDTYKVELTTENHKIENRSSQERKQTDSCEVGDVKEVIKTAGENKSTSSVSDSTILNMPKRKRGRPPKQPSIEVERENTNQIAKHADHLQISTSSKRRPGRSPKKRRKSNMPHTSPTPQYKDDEGRLVKEVRNTVTRKDESEPFVEVIPDQKTPRRSRRLMSILEVGNIQNDKDTVKISEREKLDKENKLTGNCTGILISSDRQLQSKYRENNVETEQDSTEMVSGDARSKSQQQIDTSTVEDAAVNCAEDIYIDSNDNHMNRISHPQHGWCSLFSSKDVDVYDIDSETNQIELYGCSTTQICERNLVSTVNIAEQGMNEAELKADDLKILEEQGTDEAELKADDLKTLEEQGTDEAELNTADELKILEEQGMQEYDLESEVNREEIFGNEVNTIQHKKQFQREDVCEINKNKKDDISEIIPPMTLINKDDSDSDIEADVNAMQLYLGACDGNVSSDCDNDEEFSVSDHDDIWDEMSSESPVQETMSRPSHLMNIFQLDSPACSASVDLDSNSSIMDPLEPLSSSSLSSFSDISNFSYHGNSSSSPTKDDEAKENVDLAVEDDDVDDDGENGSIFICHGNTSSSSPLEDAGDDNIEHSDGDCMDTSQESLNGPVMNPLFREVSETGNGKQYNNRLVVSNKEEGASDFQELFHEDNIFF